MPYQTEYFLSTNENGLHKIAYHIWGPDDGQPLVAVHGLTCNGKDFGPLARTLAKGGFRVIAVDLAGRGKSDRLKESTQYNPLQYLSDLSGLLTHLGYTAPASIDWLGVSLGGMLGMMWASAPASPIRRLILNDIGPEIPLPFLEALKIWFAEYPLFETQQDLNHHMRTVTRASWGPMEDDDWRAMGFNNTWFAKDDKFSFAYDHAIVKHFTKFDPTEPRPDLWPCWNALTCPVLVLHGEESMVLPRSLIHKMGESGPNFDLHSFRDCGHVPSLVPDYQQEVVRSWLQDTPI